ncbi:alpha-glucosidase [Siphonobacter sp. SORGH_AS_0500]|uniref:glycoside hydrolase family 13 protein n=1 Tax=Siphonobacter sp. SORGH_AS_0500 TaxID=1864824 RepID=UPI002859E36E|nr:alpha-glucosidase [Siphonobacter sp. SORGH_AS_0500]MDR6195762.1 oligo-1,6-glucosidase [Siphonobacter sp. SORGH_AS_0500]
MIKKTIQLVTIIWMMGMLHAQAQVNKNYSKQRKWWKEAVVYQLYPRSFKDSDGDGVGDLKGITEKLDYLKSLGVDVVWLNPIYSSPNDDNGYDISDYRNIMKEFGTMKDFDQMLEGMHERGMRLVMDLVVNHSSDEHEWFRQARSSRDSKYRNYYHWWPEEKGTPPYRYSLFDVNHDAWKYDTLTRSYYLHYFSRKQPDLNWSNPDLRKEVYDIMKFWADKGVDGFRMDAFQFCVKDTSFPVFEGLNASNFVQFYAMVPPIHDYLQEMHKEVYAKYNLMSVAEGAGRNMQDAHDLVDTQRKELNMAYAFDAVDVSSSPDYSMLKLKKTFTKWDKEFQNDGWLSIFMGNHDQSRVIDRIGNPSEQYREASAKLISTFLLTMRGTPYIYNGDEIGMTNAGFKDISEFKDIQTINEYKYQQSQGGDLAAFMQKNIKYSRDNSRTPFQWNDEDNAGFSTSQPWIRVGNSYKEINLQNQENNPESCVNYFRQMVKFRKDNKVLVYGDYTVVDENNPNIYAYTRIEGNHKLLVVLNFSDVTSQVTIPKAMRVSTVEINNLLTKPTITNNTIALLPWQAVIYKLN